MNADPKLVHWAWDGLWLCKQYPSHVRSDAPAGHCAGCWAVLVRWTPTLKSMQESQR